MADATRSLSELETMLALRRVPLFEGLDPEDLQRIAATAVERTYAAGRGAHDRGRPRATSSSSSSTARSGWSAPSPTARPASSGRTGRASTSASWPSCASDPRVGDGHGRGRRGARPRRVRRGPQVHPARASRRGDGDARHPRRAPQPAMTVAGRTAGALPVGTVTFLRTDVEGSMGLVRRLGLALGRRQRARTWPSIRAGRRGHAAGSSCGPRATPCFAVFAEAGSRLWRRPSMPSARSPTEAWPDGAAIRVRMGCTPARPTGAGDDYGGFDVNRAARDRGRRAWRPDRPVRDDGGARRRRAARRDVAARPRDARPAGRAASGAAAASSTSRGCRPSSRPCARRPRPAATCPSG